MSEKPKGAPDKSLPPICYLCSKDMSAQGAESMDHVPPKGLFPKPIKGKLIKVPACKRCHGSDKSLDDEYLRTFLTNLGQDVHPEAKRHFDDKVMRSLKKSQGLRNRVFRDSRPIDYFTKSGIYVGQGRKVLYEEARILRALEDVVRGLYFWEYEKPLPASAPVIVSGYTDLPDAYLALASLCTRRGWREHDIFVYCGEISNEVPTHSFWVLSFYRAFVAVATTDASAWPPPEDWGQAPERGAANQE